jgi:hypothetical protein
MIRNRKVLRCIAVYLLVQFSVQVFLPGVSYALTSGPSQPEFSSFEPVATTNMVDEFTGDFTYNLPVLEVPGPQGSSYPLSLSYHSGVAPEEESSWVGYGWTLNPGAINRGTRGLPDDYKGNDVIFHNKMPKNWTGTVGAGIGMGEIFGVDLKKTGTSVSANVSVRYNNYRGFGYNAGIGLSLGKGLVSMGYGVSDGTGSFSLNVNPYAILSWNFKNAGEIDVDQRNYTGGNYTDKEIEEASAAKRKALKGTSDRLGQSANLMGSSYGVFSYTHAGKPNIVQGYTGKSFNVSVNVEVNPGPVPIGGTATLSGSYSFQKNNETETVPSYGFMYSSEANTSTTLMDYHVEHEKDFNKRDVFLGVPFNDADNFIVTGEGIGGGFRLHNKTAGHFGPRRTESITDIFNVGAEFGAGWTFGPGGDLGKGSHTLTVGDWDRLSTKFTKVDKTTDEPVFFRFNNDMGGEWGTNHDDSPLRANLSGNKFSLPADKSIYNQESGRTARSSYIGYHTNEEMGGGADISTPVSYSKNEYVNGLAGRNDAKKKSLIGEFTVYNTSGNQYVYGLPVYTRNEKNLSYRAKGLSSIEHNYIAYTESPNTDILVGEEKNDLYGVTYLLTEITTPEYLDRGKGDQSTRGESGPSDDDLGGYTRFNYDKKTSESNWYKWRAPYRGLIYNKNSHSDPLDDLVSYSEGEKEIYYLHSIETKTHVAIFTLLPRVDGKEGPETRSFSSDASPGDLASFKLTKIELYPITDCLRDGSNGNLVRDPKSGSPKISDNAQAIKTVHFEYDNSLVPGLPNAEAGAGKLTLKRVYFDYNNVKRARISPYEFKYEYPKKDHDPSKPLETSYADYPGKYNGEVSEEEDVTLGYKDLSQGTQNPGYTPFFTDAWGNYQKNGLTRFGNMQPWVTQKAVADFDPAAWSLKVIKLPSGGEIHVQYQQDDYSYVQNQEAHVMAPLKYEPNESELLPNRYVVNTDSIGLTVNDLGDAAAMINKRYVQGNHKIYFKFLYSLVDNVMPQLNNMCNAEFISGYAKVVHCAVEGSTPESKELVVYLANEGAQRLPLSVCKDFVKSQRLGKVDPTANCNPSGMSDPNDPKALVSQLLTLSKALAIKSVGGKEQLCMHINKNYSYFRIPTPLAKKGGGVRVKRLMMYDKGFENNVVLYGNEYLYQVKDKETGRIISSGVATNEPQTIREENILVDFVARKGENLWSRIVAGRDKDKAEGPLGESILPGASVGYSNIIVRNIHSGKSNPGFSVTEFYTAKDYPVQLAHPDNPNTMTSISRESDDPFPVTLPLYTQIKARTSATQGFSFVLNSMHGQFKSKTSYQGPYGDEFNFSNATIVSRTAYEYFAPGEKIPMMSSLYGGITLKNPGREVDITFAQRSVKEVSNDLNVEVDIQLTILPIIVPIIIPYPTAIPSYSYIEGELNTHSTTKVVRYPAIVKSVTVEQDEIKHTDENLAFDEYTGTPVAVRSMDEFNGGYLSQSVPASWEYNAMGGKWKSEGKIVGGQFTFSNDVIMLGTDACVLAEFTSGDKIQLGGSSAVIYYVSALDPIANGLRVERAKGSTEASSSFSEITILRSGRTNQLQAQVGNITMHDVQKQNLIPVKIDQVNRYEGNTANTFLHALQDKIDLAMSGPATGEFDLSGTYENVDMSAFASKLQGCNTDLRDATVTYLQYSYVRTENGQLILDLMLFKIYCEGNPDPVTIAAEGWQ